MSKAYETLTKDGLLEEAAEAASFCDEPAAAEAILDRGKRAADALELLPEGWTVLREQRASSIISPSETIFMLRDADGDEMVTTRRIYSRRDGVHCVQPGSTTNRLWAEEVYGRAAVLLLAGIDCEGRPDEDRDEATA